MKLTIALQIASLAAFTYVGSQFSYAEDLLDAVLNTCIGYVHKQIPDSKFDAYIVDRSTGALNKFGTERDFVEFDKCKQNIWETIRHRTLEDKQKAISQYGRILVLLIRRLIAQTNSQAAGDTSSVIDDCLSAIWDKHPA